MPRGAAGASPPGKKPRLPESLSDPGNERPSWRIRTADRDQLSPFSWSQCVGSDMEAVRDRLASFETMKWSQIAGRDHHNLSPSSLSNEAWSRLRELQLDDYADSLFSFHVNGKKRIVGFRDRHLFLVLWWDSEHQVAPSTKRHT